MLSDHCPLRLPVLPVLSCLSATFVYCGETVGWIKLPLGTEVGLGPGDIVLDGDPVPSPAHVYCGQTAKRSPISVTAELLFTSPAGAVAKYCDDREHVCLFASISPEPHARYLYQFFCACMLPVTVARSSSGRVTKSQGKGQFWPRAIQKHWQSSLQPRSLQKGLFNHQ